MLLIDVVNKSQPSQPRMVTSARTLPLTPQRVTQKANLSFRNRFLYISITDEASDFKFGKHLRFAKAHHEIPLEEIVGVALG